MFSVFLPLFPYASLCLSFFSFFYLFHPYCVSGYSSSFSTLFFYAFFSMKFLLLDSSPPHVPFAHVLSLSTLISLCFLLSLFFKFRSPFSFPCCAYVFYYMKFLLLHSSPPYIPFSHLLSLSTLIALCFLLSLFFSFFSLFHPYCLSVSPSSFSNLFFTVSLDLN